MGVSSAIEDIKGIAVIQVEGFFTERFINLCKINNIKIWDIRQIVQGVIRFKIHICDFKKLAPIARKTKCQIKIKEKKGIYFTLFKYRKKKPLMYIFMFFVIFMICFSMFIWQINITGNNQISTQEIIAKLKESGIYVGKCKIGLNKKDVVNKLRVDMPEISWAGLEIEGSNANVEIVEKTVSKTNFSDEQKIGDIVADKTGILTKIIAENGTAKYKEGSYIEPGFVLIEGTIYSKVIEPQAVHAKGIVRAKNDYIFEQEYKFKQTQKKYNNKVRYTIGFSINNKENMLNYLNKNKKYDITKNGKTIKIFSKDISFNLYKCSEYNQIQVEYSRDDLVKKAQEDSQIYVDNISKSLKNSYIIDSKEYITDTADGIKYKKIYEIDEEIGAFQERN